MARKKPSRTGGTAGEAGKARLLTDQAVALAEFAARALVAAEQLRVKTRPVDGLHLQDGEREALSVLPAVPAKVRKKLVREGADLTVAEVAGLTMAVAEAFPDAEPKNQVGLLLVAKKLMDCLQKNVVMPVAPAKGKNAKSAGQVYRIKVTLKDTRPPVWRRIVVEDCTLDRLHEHLQTAMGWTNSHLHHFRVGGQSYGDPDLMAGNFEEFDYRDSTATRLSDLVPAGRKKLRFGYEYDFGDSWDHDLEVEAVGPPEAGVKYPVCVAGERACPPEDVGGVWGYADFVDAVRNPDHEQHGDMLEWAGGSFDPDAFDPAAATRRMRKGLPDWRRMG